MKLTWPSPVGGAVPPHKLFFPSLLTPSLFACHFSMSISFVGGAKLQHSVLSSCAPTKLFSEGKIPSRELKYTTAVVLQTTMWHSQVQPREPQMWAAGCTSWEALCSSQGSWLLHDYHPQTVLNLSVFNRQLTQNLPELKQLYCCIAFLHWR